MAKRRRRRSRSHARRANGRFVSSGSAPVVVRRSSSPKVTVVRVGSSAPKKHHRRRSGGGGTSLGSLGGSFLGGRGPILIGAAALGFAHKEGWLAKIPLVGKAGPVTSFGVIGWGLQKFLKVRLPDIVDKGVTAALTISAFNIGAQGLQGGVIGNEYGGGGAVVFD